METEFETEFETVFEAVKFAVCKWCLEENIEVNKEGLCEQCFNHLLF